MAEQPPNTITRPATEPERYIEELKKQYPNLNVDPGPDAKSFTSMTREERMELMAKRVEEVSKAMGEPNPHAPMPGNSEPWWKTFVNFESDLRETIDQKTRDELSELSRKMYAEGLTTTAINEAREAALKLVEGYPKIAVQVGRMLFNEESLVKIRESYEKSIAEGKPGFLPYPLGKGTGDKKEGQAKGS